MLHHHEKTEKRTYHKKVRNVYYSYFSLFYCFYLFLLSQEYETNAEQCIKQCCELLVKTSSGNCMKKIRKRLRSNKKIVSQAPATE